MALGSRLVFLVVLLFFFLFYVEAQEDAVRGWNPKPTPKIDCQTSCAVRCSVHSRPNVCNRACKTCCERCNCVPPGTSGNREVCGLCYTSMKTHGDKFKCP